MPATGLARTGTYLAIFITALTSVLWVTLVMQPRGWALKISPYYTVETGVWQVSISRGAVLKLVAGNGPKMKKILSFFTPAVRSTEDFKEYLCGISEMAFIVSDVCLVGSNLYIASVTLIGTVFFGSFLNWCACAFLAMWAFMKPRESSRVLARILYFMSFCVYTGGLVFYTTAANNLKDLPPSGDQVAFGRNVWCGICLCILQFIPLFVVFVFVRRTRDEAMNEHASWKKKEAREESRLANKQYMEEVGYGAAGGGYSESYESYGAYGAYGAYGSDPSMQASFQDPSMQASFQDPSMQASFQDPSMQASFQDPSMQAPFQEPSFKGQYEAGAAA